MPAGVAAFTVTAKDASDHTATGYTGTVHFTATDPAAVLPPDYTFVGADAGTHTFKLTFQTLGSQAVTATDAATSSITGNLAVTVTPGVAATLVVSGLPCNAVVTAKDAFGNNATSYTGTVHFTATDPAAVLPPDYTFVGADAGTHTFPVTLTTAGSQGVTATDFASSLTGSEAVTVGLTTPDKPFYVANSGNNSIIIYAAGDSCNATPARTISGSNTGLDAPYSIALDAAGRLYVANSRSITVYAAGATGNATPTATIAGSDTGFTGGIALDVAGQLYVANSFNCNFSDCYDASITVYAAGATGNPTPTATIHGSNTGLRDPAGIALDGAGRLYVANARSITVYAAGDTGNATPIATIEGTNTGLYFPAGIALDATGRLYVANPVGPLLPSCGPGSIAVFAAGANGNATPIATIEGSNTGLNTPAGIALDAAGRLYVANPGFGGCGSISPSNTITVYTPGATGNVAPTGRIAGSNTGLNFPTSITF
ncbi:MAG TPA: NHL repeat-containing protein [Gemmatimonadales bacterium]|nr:NHL repeat-containing protein [Gemmatimonadales bacterium]